MYQNKKNRHRQSIKIQTMEKIVFSNLAKKNQKEKEKRVCFDSCDIKKDSSPIVLKHNNRWASTIQTNNVSFKEKQLSSKSVTDSVKLVNHQQPKKFLSSKFKLPLIECRK